MKHVFFLAAITFLAGITAPAADSATMAMEQKNITAQDARDAAMKRITGGTIVRTQLDRPETGGASYKLVMVDDDNRYNVTVNALTGRVTNVDKNTIISDRAGKSLAATGGTSGRGAISPERAKQIAMERVRGGNVVGVDSEMRNNRLVYDIDMLSNNATVEMKMDANTGEIISFEEEFSNRRPGSVQFRRIVFQRGATNPDSRNSGNQSR